MNIDMEKYYSELRDLHLMNESISMCEALSGKRVPKLIYKCNQIEIKQIYENLLTIMRILDDKAIHSNYLNET